MRLALVAALLVLTSSGCSLFGGSSQASPPNQGAGDGASADASSSELDVALNQAKSGNAELQEMMKAVVAWEAEVEEKGWGAYTPQDVVRARSEYEALFAAREAQAARVDEVKALDTEQTYSAQRSSLVDDLNRIPKTVRNRGLLSREEAATAPASQSVSDLRVLDERDIFLHAHPERFRFLTREVKGGIRYSYAPSQGQRPLAAGEPVLVVGNLKVMAIDGVISTVKAADLSPQPVAGSIPHPLQPSWLTVRDKGTVVANYWTINGSDSTGYELDVAPFMPLVSQETAGYDEFIAARTKTLACFDTQMKKLDPTGTRKKFLLETRKGGKSIKLEKLADVYDRKACKKCNCKGFNRKKQAIAQQVAAPLQQQQYQALTPAIERVNGLFVR